MFEDVQSVIATYTNRPAQCQKYDAGAVAVADHVASLISEQLSGIIVEHVGSTAVPGCAGEGIVDLMIPVPDGEKETVEALLDRLGFQTQTDRRSFPEDRPLRAGAFDHDGKTFLLHVHALPAASPAVDGMRFFRDCLTADPELRKLYVRHKKKIIASGATDPAEYCAAKGEFITQVLG